MVDLAGLNQSAHVSAERVDRLPEGAVPLAPEPRERDGVLGVVLAGDVVEELPGVVDVLGGDHEDGGADAVELLAESISVGACGLHGDLDRAPRLLKRGDEREEETGLRELIELDDLDDLAGVEREGGGEIELGDVMPTITVVVVRSATRAADTTPSTFTER